MTAVSPILLAPLRALPGPTLTAPPVRITVAVVTHNGEAIIAECLRSVMALRQVDFDLVVIDNSSTDRTREIVREQFPDAHLVRMPANQGPNPARNAALRFGANRHVLLIDDDVVLEPDCAAHLLDAMFADANVALTSGRTVYYDRPDTVQYSGPHPHYLGEAIFRHGEWKLAECPPELQVIPVGVSTFLLIDRERALEIGGFDEYYFFGKTDADFTIRLTAAGFDIVEAPFAVARHRVKLRGFRNVTLQIRNRWYYMIKIYSARTLLLIAPMLMVDEALRIVFLTAHGAFRPWLRGTVEAVRDLPKALRARRATKRHRRRGDGEILTAGSMVMRPDLIRHPTVAFFKVLYDRFTIAYWKLVRRLL